MKKLRYLSLIILVLMLAMTGSQAFAECDEVSSNYWVCSGTFVPPAGFEYDFSAADDTIVIPTGTVWQGYGLDAAGGSDTVINNGTFYGLIGGEMGSGHVQGNDLIINNGSVLFCPANFCGGGIIGYGGNDTLINNGTVQEQFDGGPGDDVLINRGTIIDGLSYTGDMDGDGIPDQWLPGVTCDTEFGNDIITNSGEVRGMIKAGCGDDTVNLEPGANGSSDNYLLIDGGGGEDTLVLAYNTTAVDDAVTANASSGTITIDGQTFEWTNFEHIVKGTPADGRLNGRIADNARTAAVYCSEAEEGGVTVYGINDEGEGYLLFSVSSEDAHAALELAQSNGEHVMIAEEDGQSLWALTSNELQIHDVNGEYDFIFSPVVCGVPLAN